MSIKKTNQVVYVEPNADETLKTAYSTSVGTVMKSPDPEDFCIIVDLEVEVKGRTFTYSNAASQDNIVVRAVENTNGQTVSFMKGSRVYTNADHTEYINSLTTNYTDSTLLDIQNDSPAECFGIKSIDISYSNFMVPEITIQFVDVRGLSLFAQEEMRHNVVKQGIAGQANNSIEGSFFKSFFTFPYPKFTLRVKGFYGQMVSYELTCSDFRAAFQSESGNFNVTAKFVGYSFSFLNDVMANMMLAAPYSEYKGKQFWNDKVTDGSFTIVGKNGQNVGMTKLGEICKKFTDIKNQVQQELEKEGLASAAEKYRSQCGFSDDDIEALKSKSVADFKNNYDTAMSDLNGKLPKNSEDGQTYVVRVGNSVCVFADETSDQDSLSGLVDSFNSTFTKMKDDEEAKRNTKIKEWLDTHSFGLKAPGDYNAIVIGGSANEDGTTEINANVVKDKELREALQKAAKQRIRQAKIQNKKNTKEKDDSPTYAKMWLNNRNSQVFIYQDFGLKAILDEATAASVQNEQELKEKIDKLSTQLQREKFVDAFDFDPTVENITKIIMAHFVTYINLIGSCAKSIISTGTNRNPDTINVSLDDFDDTQKDVPIPPFPSVTKLVTDNDGNEKREDTWIGEYGTADVFEEISLVEGLLTGVYNVSREISYGSNADGGDGSDGSSGPVKCGVYNPTSIADLAIESNSQSPFGKPDFTDANSVFAHIAMRGYATLCNKFVGGKFTLTDLASWDAENFMDSFQANEDFTKLKNALAGDLNGDKLYTYLSTGKLEDAPNPSAKSNPWKTNGGLFVNGSAKKEYIRASIGKIQPNGNGGLFPFKDWTFDELISSCGNNKGTLTNGSLGHFMGTPCDKEGSLSEYNAVWLFDKRVSYIAKSTENVYTFKDYKFDADKFKSTFFNDKYEHQTYSSKEYKTGSDSTAHTGEEVLTYNDDGSLSNSADLIKDFGSVFWVQYNNDYYSYSNNITSQAWYFLRNAFPFMRVEKNLKEYYELLMDSHARIIYMPKFLALYLGCYMATHKGAKGKKPRPRTMQVFIDEFVKWRDGGFKKIKSVYEPKFKKGQTADAYDKATHASHYGMSNGDADTLLNSFTKEYKTIFNQNCELVTDSASGMRVRYKATTAMQEILDELLGVTTVLIATPSNATDVQGVWALESELKGYLNHMIDDLRGKLGVATDNQDPNSDSAYGSLNLDPDDMKVGVYNYIKMLYDKWVASDIDCTEYTMEKMFTSNEPKFYFIDSIYNKIGQSYYINIGTLVDMLVSSQSTNGYSMLSMMGDLYSSNKMLFLCLQNFADFANDNMLEKMFRPVPYLECEEPKNRPNFIVVYPGEASSKLDIDNSDYPDDTFYLNESTGWPEMIKNKKGDGMPIPAFGVSYGQQYQSYFTNVQVDMNTPIATEQSIKAKFMLCGGSTSTENDGPRNVTVGQDLYAIYSNNSYTCTVTMLGCAWVQPMMYFVLLNVPMFRGSYQIIRVTHQIQAGKMVTTFVGVRMANTYTRAVKQYIYGSNNDPSDGTSREQLESQSANIDNDCDWAYYSPLGGGVDGKIVIGNAKVFDKDTTGTSKPSSLAKNNPTGLQYKGDDGKWHYYEFGSIAEGFKATANNMLRTCTGKLGTCPNNPSVLDVVCSWVDGNLYNNLSASEQSKMTAEAQKRAEWAGMAYNVKFSITLDILTRLVGSFAMWEVGYRNKADVTKGCKMAWEEYYKGSTPPSSITAKKGTVKYMQEYASGFTQSIQSTLNASNTYKSTKVTGSYDCHETYATVELKATGGDNPNNAMFDAIQNQYSQHWKMLSWNIGAGNANANASSVVVLLVDSEPSEHIIRVIKNYKLKGKAEVVNLSTEKDVNEKFKLSMIKHFKKNNIKSAEAAKTRCTSLAKMADDTVKSVFEIANTGESAVQDCSSVLGGSMTGGAGNAYESGGIIRPTSTAIISNDFQCGAACEAVYNYTIQQAGGGSNVDISHHNCVSGVMKAVLAGFKAKYPGNQGVWTSPHKANWWLHELPKRGWVMVAEVTRFNPTNRFTKEARKYFKTQKGYEPREGDIMLVNAPEVSTGNGSGSHAQIFLGGYWISDFIQKSNWVVYKSTSHVQIFRYAQSGKWYW